MSYIYTITSYIRRQGNCHTYSQLHPILGYIGKCHTHTRLHPILGDIR